MSGEELSVKMIHSHPLTRCIDIKESRERIEHTSSAPARIPTPTRGISNIIYDVLSRSDINIFEHIGSGRFSCVFKGECRGKEVAIKVIDGKSEPSYVSQELEILSQIRHPNICSCMGSYVENNDVYIIMPLYMCSLVDVIYTHNLSINISLNIARDIAVGLNWIHSQTPKLIHSDIKPSNIMLDENYHAIICDF